MDKNTILESLKKLREKNKKRNFIQTLEFIINLKNLDIKKPENKIEFFFVLPKGLGKKRRICAILEYDLAEKAKDLFDKIITKEKLEEYKDKKKAKKLAKQYDIFIAQATLMVKVAAYLGKFLGPRGKMPNPKMGGIVTPATNLKELAENLKNMVKLSTKHEPSIKVPVGTETMEDKDLAENIFAVYEFLLQNLPQGRNNIKNMFIKFTMSPPEEIK